MLSKSNPSAGGQPPRYSTPPPLRSDAICVENKPMYETRLEWIRHKLLPDQAPHGRGARRERPATKLPHLAAGVTQSGPDARYEGREERLTGPRSQATGSKRVNGAFGTSCPEKQGRSAREAASRGFLGGDSSSVACKRLLQVRPPLRLLHATAPTTRGGEA